MEYDGEWVNNQKHGKGACKCWDGSVYIGEWKHDKKNGHGILTTRYGGKYEGEWKDDKKEGYGVWEDQLGKFEGLWQNDKYFKGEYVSRNFKYSGEWLNDVYHGIGTTYIPSYPFNPAKPWVPTYDGGWANGQRQGKGKEYYTTSENTESTISAEGTYVKGQRHGHFKEFFSSRVMWFEGEYANGLKEGPGKEFHNGVVFFEGSWVQGNKHGQAKVFVNGRLFFDGECENGIEKKGKLYDQNGLMYYEGTMTSAWRAHGYGIFYLNGVKVYEGEWKEGKYHGLGTSYYNGVLFAKGVFADGVLVNGYQRNLLGNLVQETIVKEDTKHTIRRCPNGDIFKLVDPVQHLWIGRATENNCIVVGSFRGFMHDGKSPAKYGSVMTTAGSVRTLETWDDTKCVSRIKYLAEWTTQDIIGWLSPVVKSKFGLIPYKNKNKKLQKFISQNHWSGFDLMTLDTPEKLEKAGITKPKTQHHILNLIEYHKSEMKKIQDLIHQFPEIIKVTWDVKRILWIGVMKNNPSECTLAVLPRDVLRYLIQFL